MCIRDSGQTVYNAQSFSTTGIPAGTYTAGVYYRPDASVSGNWQAAAWSPFGAATITAQVVPSITMTSPTAGALWPAGSTQSLGFTLSSAVSVGEFDGFLVNTLTGAWYGAGMPVVEKL